MSASSMPHVGPAMICASSTTLIPFNAPFIFGRLDHWNHRWTQMNTDDLRRVKRRAHGPAAIHLHEPSVFICVHLWFLFAFEFGFLLGEKGLVADLEVFGAEAGEAFVVFGGGERARVAQPPREFLVPAPDARPAIGEALRGRTRPCFASATRPHAR